MMKQFRTGTAIVLSALLALAFTGCGGTAGGASAPSAASDSASAAASGTQMTDEERIVSAAQAKKVGNWGLGNEYEIQALLAKYGQSTDYVSMDFTMDQFDTDAITLASAMTYNELGLVVNSYDGALGYGDKVGTIDMNDQGVAMLEDTVEILFLRKVIYLRWNTNFFISHICTPHISILCSSGE